MVYCAEEGNNFHNERRRVMKASVVFLPSLTLENDIIHSGLCLASSEGHLRRGAITGTFLLARIIFRWQFRHEDMQVTRCNPNGGVAAGYEGKPHLDRQRPDQSNATAGQSRRRHGKRDA